MILLYEETANFIVFHCTVGVTQFICCHQTIVVVIFTIALLYDWLNHNVIQCMEDDFGIIVPSTGNRSYFSTIIVFGKEEDYIQLCFKELFVLLVVLLFYCNVQALL